MHLPNKVEKKGKGEREKERQRRRQRENERQRDREWGTNFDLYQNLVKLFNQGLLQ